MSSSTIELFRQHTEKQQQEAHEPRHKSQAHEPTKQPKNPNLIREMSRIEHEVRQMFDDASPAERDNIIRFLEVLIRDLKRQAGHE